jgi:hypothetical protein
MTIPLRSIINPSLPQQHLYYYAVLTYVSFSPSTKSAGFNVLAISKLPRSAHHRHGHSLQSFRLAKGRQTTRTRLRIVEKRAMRRRRSQPNEVLDSTSSRDESPPPSQIKRLRLDQMTNATSVPNYSTQGKLYEERKKRRKQDAREPMDIKQLSQVHSFV